jgi:hypothetical protein
MNDISKKFVPRRTTFFFGPSLLSQKSRTKSKESSSWPRRRRVSKLRRSSMTVVGRSSWDILEASQSASSSNASGTQVEQAKHARLREGTPSIVHWILIDLSNCTIPSSESKHWIFLYYHNILFNRIPKLRYPSLSVSHRVVGILSARESVSRTTLRMCRNGT